MLTELRITACIAMLALAAIIDVKKREIPDKIWLGFGAFGALLAILQFTSGPDDVLFGSPPSINALFPYLLGIGIMAPIGYAVYKTGLFGGADSKALVALAVLMPTYDGALFKIHGFTALTVLTNALIISMSQLVFNSARNLVAIAKGVPIFEGIEEGTARKALAFAMGYRSTSAQGYLFPMEGIDESGKRKFAFNPARYDEFVEEQEDQQTSQRPMWVTQALPFIVYIALGFGVALTIGDIFGAIIQNFIPLPKI
jgi:archaeal preflagellin peptidase FlaK